MTWLRFLIPAVLVLGLTASPAEPSAPAPPPEPSALNDSEAPGSVLVFHKFIRGTLPATEIEISVTCPKDSQCADYQTVFLRAHWVCPGDAEHVCRETVFDLQTTVKGTLFFSPDSLPADSQPHCRQGYLIVWVIDYEGHPIKFDGLIGNAVIRHTVAVDAIAEAPNVTSAGAYNALPIQAAAHLATGHYTDANGNNDGKLDFDGGEYKAITGTIYGTVRYEELGIQTSLTLLTLDVASNQPNAPTSVDLNFFNEQEHLKFAHVDFTCWTQVRLAEIDRTLNREEFGRKGLVESTSALRAGHPATVVGIVSTIKTFETPVEPGVCELAAATCDATCRQGDATCTAACDLTGVPARNTVCSTAFPFGVCGGLTPVGCAACRAAYDATVGQIDCTSACTATQGACTSACTAANGACQVVGATLSVPGVSEYSYSLFNDSAPVPTTYDPGYF